MNVKKYNIMRVNACNKYTNYFEFKSDKYY